MRIGARLLCEEWAADRLSETRGAATPVSEYEPPALVVLGDVRSLTLGGPSGVGDSLAPGIQRP